MSSGGWLAALLSLPWELVGRLLAAAVLGGLIGLEREWHDHPAGLRTNMLVALGACLFTILSITGFPLEGTTRDSARVAAQVVSGIGFLGGVAVFRDRDRVRGLTTAATIWFVTAIGMAVGVGSYFLALFATLLALIILVVLRPIGDWIGSRSQ